MGTRCLATALPYISLVALMRQSVHSAASVCALRRVSQCAPQRQSEQRQSELRSAATDSPTVGPR